VSTIAGSGATGVGNGGYADGIGIAAKFNNPSGITIDSSGNLYVTDAGNNCIRKIANDGPRTVSTIAGDGTWGYADGSGTNARFNWPEGISIDSWGNLYVADAGNDYIRKIDNGNSRMVTTIAGNGVPGYTDGIGIAARVNHPFGITIDSWENLYVADTDNHRIRKIAADNNRTVTTIAGDGIQGSTNGIGTAARFNYPLGITIDAAGNLYVVDNRNQCIRKLSYQRID
jgi:sugar lactone lactonase YvrE